MKRVIALGALVVGGVLLVAPSAGAATSECPPGAGANNPYCTAETALETHNTSATGGGVAKIALHCAKSGPRCKGTLLLLLGAHGSTVGSSSYSIAAGQTAKVSVKLSKQGRAILNRKGKLRVTAVSVSEGKRTVIGTVLIKGKKKAKHVTNAHTQPGFTG